MSFTYKIFNSRTNQEVEETKAFDSADGGAFQQWLDDNNVCYESDDANRPENDACDYELKVYKDGNQVFFNPATNDFDLTEEIVSEPVDPGAESEE